MTRDPREIAQRIRKEAVEINRNVFTGQITYAQFDTDACAAILAAEMPRWVPQKFVWCEICGIIEYEVDEMKASGANTHDAQDVLCPKCRLVICTFHESQSPPSPPREEAK